MILYLMQLLSRYFVLVQMLAQPDLSHISAQLVRLSSSSELHAVCSGYNPDTLSFSPVGVSLYPMSREGMCAKDYAYINVDIDSGVGPLRPGERVALRGNCCKLPTGVLLDKHVFSLTECPTDYVATGIKTVIDRQSIHYKDWYMFSHQLRCTKIDTIRYQLSTYQPGWHWGLGGDEIVHLGYKLFGSIPRRTQRAQMPISFRYSVGRLDYLKWSASGCIGYPWGSLLVKKTGKYCNNLFFAELQFRGFPGDPPAGTAVQIFPKCLALDDPTNPDPKCISDN